MSRRSRGGGRRGLFVLAGALLVAAVVLAVLLSPWDEGEKGGEVAAPPAQNQAAAPVVREPVAVAARQLAVVEDVSPEPPLAQAAPVGDAHAGIGGALAAGDPSPQADGRVPLKALTDSSPVAQAQVAQAQAPSAPASSSTEHHADVRGVAQANSSANRGRSRQEERKQAPASDSDAALLAALVAHEDGTSAKAKTPASAPAKGKPVSASGKQKAAATRKRAADPNGDVVEEDSKTPTAELIQRCDALGLIEGFLCKRRICSSRQEDPACPQPAAASPPIGGV